MITSKLVGDSITYTIYRDGERKEIVVTAENPAYRIPLVMKESFISFVMFAGLVFLPVFNETSGFNVSETYNARMRKKDISHLYESDQCVVLTSVLPHTIGIGYEDTGMYMPLYKVNDTEIRNISDVARAIAKTGSDMITFEFVTDDCIVLPFDEGIKATLEIQQDYGMATVVSADVLEVLTSEGIEYIAPSVLSEDAGDSGSH